MPRQLWLRAYLSVVSCLSLVSFVPAVLRDGALYADPWLWIWLVLVGAAYRHLCRIQSTRGISGATSLGGALLMITFWLWGLSPAMLMLFVWLSVGTSWIRRILNMTNAALSMTVGWLMLRYVTAYPVPAEEAVYVAVGLVGFIVTSSILMWLPRHISAPMTLKAYFQSSARPLLEELIFDLALALTVANAHGASGLPGVAVIGLLLFARYRSLQKSVELQDQRELSIRALIRAMEARDPYTSGHSERVAGIARNLGLAMGLSTAQATQIWEAGLLHDVGKIGIPDGILCKTGALTAEEYRTIQQHAAGSEQILRSRPDWEHLAEVVGQHHEWYNGKGYPRGLSGQEIRLEARILCVADAYDAMTSNRSYRSGRPPAAALAEIGRNAGTQFDPSVAGAFMAMMEKRLASEAPAVPQTES